MNALVEDADENIPAEAFVQKTTIDLSFDNDHVDEINDDLIQNIAELAPYGHNFEDPIIGIVDLVPDEVSTFGQFNQHLKMKCKGFEVTSWYGAPIVSGIKPKSFTLCGRLEKDPKFGIKLFCDPQDIRVKV
jgi:hypothetical protein